MPLPLTPEVKLLKFALMTFMKLYICNCHSSINNKYVMPPEVSLAFCHQCWVGPLSSIVVTVGDKFRGTPNLIFSDNIHLDFVYLASNKVDDQIIILIFLGEIINLLYI